MPTYRKLYVKTVESLDINDMPDDFTRLLWVMLPLGLCREGRGLDDPAWLKSKLFPLRRDVTLEMVTDAMGWYESRGMIQRYQVQGRCYFFVPSFHKYQGTTTRERESDYPAPLDETPEPSRPTQDPLKTNSCSDAVLSIQYSDADSDAHAPEPADAGTPPPIPSTFPQWQECVKTSTNRPATLRWMCEVLYPGLDPPEYGRIGTVARKVGGAGRLADLLWQHCTHPPTGDLMSYIQQVAKGRGNGQHRKTSGTTDAQPLSEQSKAIAEALTHGAPGSGGSGPAPLPALQRASHTGDP